MGLLGMLALGMTLGALILAYFLAGEIYDYQDTVDGVHLPRVDAIVCLAGGRGRISGAADLWYRYFEQAHQQGAPKDAPTPVLYISGMGHQSNWAVFVRQIRRGVLESIRSQDVVLERESENTDANARYLVQYAQKTGWKRVLLVTSRYHMRRAKMIFERELRAAGSPLEVETLSFYQEPFEPGEWRSGLHGVRVTVTEYLKWVYYKHLKNW
ncbi:MAG: YdcF family protein [Bdellovibrionota bacterium]